MARILSAYLEPLRRMIFFHTSLHSPQTTMFFSNKFNVLRQTTGDLKTIPETTPL